MDHLEVAFEDVADWCENHLESQRGPEIGMTFGAMLRLTPPHILKSLGKFDLDPCASLHQSKKTAKRPFTISDDVPFGGQFEEAD